MLRISIGSKNFAKVEAVKSVFDDAEVISVSVPSHVAEQPFSDEETMDGALNRARNALKEGNSQIGIGLEGGVTETASGLYLCNWGALVDVNGYSTISGGARIKLPDEISTELRNGRELGPVIDEFAQKRNVRQLEGAIGILSSGKVNRKEMFEHIVRLLAGQYEFNLASKKI
jgi:inosine/xanthosine triphosphatase